MEKLSVTEIAEDLGLSRQRVHNIIRSGQLNATKNTVYGKTGPVEVEREDYLAFKREREARLSPKSKRKASPKPMADYVQSWCDREGWTNPTFNSGLGLWEAIPPNETGDRFAPVPPYQELVNLTAPTISPSRATVALRRIGRLASQEGLGAIEDIIDKYKGLRSS